MNELRIHFMNEQSGNFHAEVTVFNEDGAMIRDVLTDSVEYYKIGDHVALDETKNRTLLHELKLVEISKVVKDYVNILSRDSRVIVTYDDMASPTLSSTAMELIFPKKNEEVNIRC